MTREEMMNEIARLRSEVMALDVASRNTDIEKVIKQLGEWGFTQETQGHYCGYYCLTLDNNIKYCCDTSDYRIYVVDLTNDDEIVYNDYHRNATEMLEGLRNMPELYLVKKTYIALKYDDGDLDNFEVIKKYKLGS